MTHGSLDKQVKLKPPVSEQDHCKGPSDAPIELVEYGDYQCPHCSLANIVIVDLLRRMGDKVRYVFRHFPLSKIHPQAQIASQAAEAAGKQGKYWEMHELLFKNQQNLGDPYIFKALANQLELNIEQFESDLNSEEVTEKIKKDFGSGARSGVNGTPTLFVNGRRYEGAWDLESIMEIIEQPLGVKIRLVTQEFASLAAAGGILLMLFTIIAIVLANLFTDDYFHFFETDLAFNFGTFVVHEHLLEWINDGLMAIFFFVVGLEIKREVTVGELATVKKALLPVAGAIGGMVFPALIYILFNLGNDAGSRGWGIPMATDIAFTIVLLTVLGKRVPFSLKVFFSALAIADDLGAVLIIAIFYSSGIHVENLLIVAIIFVILLGMNRARIYWDLPYWILGILMWVVLLESGIHPTLTGVLLAITIPTRTPANTKALLTQCVTLLDEYEVSPEEANSRRQSMINTLETITDRMQSPAQRLERDLQPWTTFAILPIFALANTGVILSVSAFLDILNPIALGIIFGLVIGKPVGITLISWITVRLGLAELPADVTWYQFVGASCLAGIGFTMSIFIANTAFVGTDAIGIAKIGILVASITAAAMGVFLLNKFSSNYSAKSTIELPIASD